MNMNKKSMVLSFILAVFLIIPQLARAARVIDNSGIGGSLGDKWNKTVTEGLKQNKSFWVAYSLDKFMAENTYFVSTKMISGNITTSSLPKFKGTPLGKLIYGNYAVETAGKKPVRTENKGKKGKYKKVKKEVAVLFLFNPNSKQSPQTIKHSDMTFPFENNGKPIYWLGKTDEKSSLPLLKGIFARLDGESVKKCLISAIGHHKDSLDIIRFLKKVIDSGEADTVRRKAAGELGERDHPSAVTILLNTAKKDHSLEVRVKAVRALEDLQFPAAVDALLDIAKNANNNHVRQKAVKTLGDVGTKKAAEALNHIVFNDPDINIQRKAVHTFEDLPGNDGVPYLINIAKTHPVPHIRKKALDCLGEFKDPRAIEAIKEIAIGK